jgi:hypothetical protein
MHLVPGVHVVPSLWPAVVPARTRGSRAQPVLECDVVQAESALSAMELKKAYYAQSRMRRGRDLSGKATYDRSDGSAGPRYLCRSR